MVSKLSLLLLLVTITACTFTTTMVKTPVFKVGDRTLDSNLKSLLTYEHVNINGVKKTTNGNSGTFMEIEVINAQNLPSDDAQLRALGKSLADL
jgi:hypothetical protein